MPILYKMKLNNHSEMIYTESDICDLIMQGHELDKLQQLTVDPKINLDSAAVLLNSVPKFVEYNQLTDTLSTEEFDHQNQQQWFMPDSYRQMDIAEHVLNLCKNEVELQRCGQELLLYQERGLFDLLRYLKYLVDVMTKNCLIWGVGRGSCVASYVLYKLGVHRIDSLYYDLDPGEFLR